MTQLQWDLLQAENRRLRTAVEKLFAWDKKYPKGRVYDYDSHESIENNLTEIIEEIRAVFVEDK